jgi:hypothetical protein
LRILVLCDFQGSGANVVPDYLYGFNRFSRHEFYYLHCWRAKQCQRLQDFDFERFDCIVLFWDCCWPDVDKKGSRFQVPPWVMERIAKSSALKVQFLQDEYRAVRKVNRVMAQFGVNLLFTCVAERDHEFFYPRSLIPSLQGTYTVLTGYVPAYLERVDYSSREPRAIDIGYRSRANAFYLGSLAQEKTQIAQAFTRIGQEHGFSLDISVREEDRLYGARWLEFLKASRFSLGTESGASVIDLDGRIQALTEQFIRANPAATFEEVKQRFFADLDGKAVIQTISPRIFEAAAFHNTLVLHEGAYAGIIQPGVHFIAVKKDYSNVAEVVAQMRDLTLCRRLADRTHEDLIRSRKYGYRSFVRYFDDILDRHRAPAPRAAVSRLGFYAVNYVNNDAIIPRAGNFLDLHAHPGGDLVKAILDRRTDALRAIASIKLMLALLSSCPPLRQRLCDALRRLDAGGEYCWIGLARDLRTLGILNCARHRQAELGQAFKVQVEFDAADKCLLLRSVPCSDETPARLNSYEIQGLLQREQIAAIVWDHGQVGDTFSLPGGRGRFFCIDINSQRIYRFDDLHGLFENQERREADMLANVLCKPSAASWLGGAATLLHLGGSLAIGVLRAACCFAFRRRHAKPQAAPTLLERELALHVSIQPEGQTSRRTGALD